MDKDWESKEVHPDEEFLGWRVINEGNSEKQVEPFLKIRTMHAWRDIGLSFTEWVLNRRGWLFILETVAFLGIASVIAYKSGVYLEYVIGGDIVGGYIGIMLGWLFSQREWSAIVVSQTEGYRTYIDASWGPEEENLGKLSYVESKVTELDIRKAPSHLINQSKLPPSMRGIQVLGGVRLVFNGHEYYMNSWQDQTHHIFIGNGSSTSLVAFLASISTLDRKVLSINKHYERVLKKAKNAYEQARAEHSAMTDEEFERAARNGEIEAKKLPKYLDLLEMDRVMRAHINELTKDIDKIESLISKNPVKMDISKLSKYTRRFVIAATTYNLQQEMRTKHDGFIPLETMRDLYNTYGEVINYWKTIPGREEKLKRIMYEQIYAVSEDIYGVGMEKIKQGLELLKKKRDDILAGQKNEKSENESLFEVKK